MFSGNYIFGYSADFWFIFFDFEVDLGCTQTEFGFAMGIQLFFWGLFILKDFI